MLNTHNEEASKSSCPHSSKNTCNLNPNKLTKRGCEEMEAKSGSGALTNSSGVIMRKKKLIRRKHTSLNYTNVSDKTCSPKNNSTRRMFIENDDLYDVLNPVPMLLTVGNNNKGCFVEAKTLFSYGNDISMEGDCHSFETLANLESGLILNIACYLSLEECISFCRTSRTMLKAMRRCRIRLDRMNRSFSVQDLVNWFDKTKNLIQWELVGARLRANKVDNIVLNLFMLKEVKNLTFTGNVESLDASLLYQCEQLTTLDAGISCRSMTGYKSLKKLKNIRHLYLRNVKELENAYDFIPNHANNLQELSLYMCRNLNNVEILRTCRNIKVLDLGGCSKLKNILGLSECIYLEKISFADCSTLEDINPLQSSIHHQLHHLDLTGCRGLRDLTNLKSFNCIESCSMLRTNCIVIVPLLEAKSLILQEEAANICKLSGFDQEDVLAPTMIDILRKSLQLYQKNSSSITNKIIICNILTIFATFAKKELGGGPSTLLQTGIVPLILNESSKITSSPIICKLSFEILAKLSQNNEAIAEIARQGAAFHIISALKRLLGDSGMIPCDNETEKALITETIEHCSSTLLFLAAIENERESLVSCEDAAALSTLVKIIQYGSPGAVAEAAGAMWNLAASLTIGAKLAETPGAIEGLVGIFENGTITAKLQAAGALRNLAIVGDNKDKLFSAGVIKPLSNLIINRAKLYASPNAINNNENLNNTSSTANITTRRPETIREEGELAAPQQSEEETLLVVKAAATLRILATYQPLQEFLGHKDFILALVCLIREDKLSKLLRQSCGIILALSFNKKNRAVLRECGTLLVLTETLKLCDGNFEQAAGTESVIVSCTGTIWNLTVQDNSKRHFSCGIETSEKIIAALIKHLDSLNIEIVCRVAGTLRSLAYCESHKNLIVVHGGIPKLIAGISGPAKVLTQCLATLRLVVSGNLSTRYAVISAGGIEALSQILKYNENEAVYLAISSLAHLVAIAPNNISKLLTCNDILRLCSWNKGRSPQLVRSDASYILEKLNSNNNNNRSVIMPIFVNSQENFVGNSNSIITTTTLFESGKRDEIISYTVQRFMLYSEEQQLNNRKNNNKLETHPTYANQKQMENTLPIVKRIRGVPGDVTIQTNNYFKNSMIKSPLNKNSKNAINASFSSYATISSSGYGVTKGKIFYEVEILNLTESPSFGWITNNFETCDYLSDYGVGYPTSDNLPQNSWAVDGIQQTKWPGKKPFGEGWKNGDVITICADIDNKKFLMGINGVYSEEPVFTDLPFHDKNGKSFFALRPGLSGSRGTKIKICFGDKHTPFKFNPPSKDYIPFAIASKLEI